MLKAIPDIMLHEGDLNTVHDRNPIKPVPFLHFVSFSLLSYVLRFINSLSGEESYRALLESMCWLQDCEWKSKAEIANAINNELHLA